MGDPVSTPPSKTQHIVVTVLTAAVMLSLGALLVAGVVAVVRWLI